MTIYQSTAYRVRQLFSTLAAVTASNPVLLEGERWHEKSATTGRFTGRTKTGDGAVSADKTTITGTAFSDLPFDPSTGGGASLSDATPQALGAAAAGTGTEASRNDHRHAMPTAAQVGADATGTAVTAVAAHVAAVDPHPVYTTTAEAAAAAPVQSVAGRTGAVALAVADVAGLGSLATQSGTFSGASSGTNTGDQTITLTGEVTGSGTGSFAATVANAAVIGKVLTGYTSGAGTVAATDTILQAIQKLNGNDSAFLTSATAATTYQPLTANLTALGANNPAYYLARANHTGTQAGSTVTGAYTAAGLTMNTARILGRSTASAGAVEEFALLGLTFNSTNLATLADLVIPLSDETSALIASATVPKLTIPYWPRATVLTDLPIWAVATAPTGAALQFDIKIGGTSIYTTLPTIAVSATNSAASAGTFSTAFISGGQSIAAGASVAFFVTQIGSTVAGAGLKLALFTRRAG